jgi:HSP20 family protein
MATHSKGNEKPRKKEAHPMRSLLPWRRRRDAEWHPFRELEAWHRSLDDLFSRFFEGQPFEGTAFGEAGPPAIETLSKNGNFIVRLDLPGVDPKEVDISVTDDVLMVKGERKRKEEKKEGEYTRTEVSYGSFERSLRLPAKIDADRIKASYESGVLEIAVPMPKELEPKKVQIEAKK